MPSPLPVPLTPLRVAPGDAGYQALLTWPFAVQPFYEGQVIRLLRSDIPQRVLGGLCSVWTYQAPTGNTVGFGTLDVCNEYKQFTGGEHHCYIPLLAVNTAFQKRGHGRTIVEHLIAEARLIAQSSTTVSDLLFLDVYSANQSAIALYQKCGFVELNPGNPMQDPHENNETYIMMAMRMAAIPAPSA
jgi:ribosomal protein S18 acetylase RimI-like enzyme